MGFATEFEFVLPKGYVCKDGNLHRSGVMRLSTAADEILPQKDPRVQSNPAYLSIILLSRVVIRLGELTAINPGIIEGLFSVDLAYLQSFYRQINELGTSDIAVACPKCEHVFQWEGLSLGEV